MTFFFALLAQLHVPSSYIPYFPELTCSLKKLNYENSQPFYLEILESKQEIDICETKVHSKSRKNSSYLYMHASYIYG